MSETDDRTYEYDGYLLYNEICFSTGVSDQSIENVPASAEAHLLDEYLPEFEAGTSQDRGEGFEPSDIRNHTDKLPETTREFVESMISLRYREEEYDTEEAEVSPDQPRQPVKIPTETSADVFWKAPNFVYIRGPDGSASEALNQLNTYLGQSATVSSKTLQSDFLLWLFQTIYNDDPLTDILEVDRLTDATVEGAEDLLGKENSVKESRDAKQAPTILIGLLHGKSLTAMEGDFVLSTGPDEEDEVTIRTEISKDKIQIKSSKSSLNNKNNIEKIGYSAHIAHEITRLYDQWTQLNDPEQVVPPTFFADLLIDSHENDIDLKDTSTILRVFRQQANRRNDDLGDYDIDEAIELLNNGG